MAALIPCLKVMFRWFLINVAFVLPVYLLMAVCVSLELSSSLELVF